METTNQPPKLFLRNLSRQSYGNGFTLWHYLAETVALPLDHFAEAYFTEAQLRCPCPRLGDHILVSAPDGAAHLYVYREDPVSVVPLSAVKIEVG